MKLIDMRKKITPVRLRNNQTSQKSEFSDVNRIIETVKINGDNALIDFTKKFDGALLRELKVTDSEIKEALANLSPALKEALQRSITNQREFQSSLLNKIVKKVEVQSGVSVWREWRPIERVGLYVPGGLAAYPSTVIMNVVPAQVAGCNEIVITTPVGKDGKVNATVLAAAAILGVTEIYKVGGAQAIAALAYGTKSIQKVDKIFGPGNQYVTIAKQIVSRDVAIDMPAGPSEVCVIADMSADPKWIAADLLAQCEHDVQAQAVLISNFKQLLDDVEQAVKLQLKKLPTGAVAEVSFKNNAVFVLVNSMNQAVEVANDYAPEHLELQTTDNYALLSQIKNAGSVFIGEYSAEALGDYVTGSNHVLPTSGFARAFSGLSVDSFGKWIEFQAVTLKGFNDINKAVIDLAEAEGLVAHAEAVKIRNKRKTHVSSQANTSPSKRIVYIIGESCQ